MKLGEKHRVLLKGGTQEKFQLLAPHTCPMMCPNVNDRRNLRMRISRKRLNLQSPTKYHRKALLEIFFYDIPACLKRRTLIRYIN